MPGWQPVADAEVHALAMDSFGVGAAAGGTMYPDHCVYLGPSVAAAGADESPMDAIERYRSRHGVAPKVLVVAGAGVLVPEDLGRAGRAMLICLKRVVERLDRSAPFGYLDGVEVARLMNWDAEKYRIGLARQYEA
jgi:rhamnose utilization protein RhaD (predicted bifunctional aldolase and dehydrogenase)